MPCADNLLKNSSCPARILRTVFCPAAEEIYSDTSPPSAASTRLSLSKLTITVRVLPEAVFVITDDAKLFAAIPERSILPVTSVNKEATTDTLSSVSCRLPRTGVAPKVAAIARHKRRFTMLFKFILLRKGTPPVYRLNRRPRHGDGNMLNYPCVRFYFAQFFIYLK